MIRWAKYKSDRVRYLNVNPSGLLLGRLPRQFPGRGPRIQNPHSDA